MQNWKDYKAAMSLGGVVLMMLIATGAMASGQQSMSTGPAISIIVLFYSYTMHHKPVNA